MRPLLALCAALLATPALAQMPDEDRPEIRAALDIARKDCADAVGSDQLAYLTGAITWEDLDGEGEPDDLVLDFNRILCGNGAAVWHGSGGAWFTFVLSSGHSASWSGGLWRMTAFNGSPVILIGRHGTHCDSYGARGCVQAIIADAEGFSTVRIGEGPLEEAR